MMNTRVLLFALAVVFFATSCTENKAVEADQDKTYTSGLYPEFMDTTLSAGNDFQEYVNGTWIKETEIPADKSAYGIGTMVHEASQENVKKIIEESAAASPEFGSDEQKVGDLYASYMNKEQRDGLGTTPLKAEFEKIDALTSHKDLAKYFAYANKLGYGTPINLFVYPDLKDPTKYGLYNWQSGLALPDREYYLSEEGKFPNIRAEYVKHVSQMMALAGVANPAKSADGIMALETKIAAKHMKKEDTRDMMSLYNLFSVDSLKQVVPDFDWASFLDEAGLSQAEKIVITQVEYTKAMSKIINDTDMDTWKAYMKWAVINDAATQLTSEIDEQNFKFYGTVLSGREEQLPQWRRGVNAVNANLGEVVGKVYVKRHFSPEAKDRMVELVNNLLKAYEVSIKALDWMGEETKKEALDKLSKFTLKIGYPDKWKNYDELVIKGDDLFGNIQRSELAEYDRTMGRLGEAIDKTEWNMNPQTVNAYYNPTMNEIVFPAAILQPPFFDMAADDAVNYGAIGAIIGHEIGHGFDDQGSTFDGDGVLRNWWTDEDRAEFKKRTDKLVAQYSGYQVFDDLSVNGDFTLGENIGDLGGLTIALKAYKMSLNGDEAPVIDGYTGTQRVFMSWAQAWRKKSREEALRMQVNTDPHSPARFRVNGVVRNIPEFYEAFNVKADDKLYLAPEDRVKIW